MQTERFKRLRKDALSKIFNKKAITVVWREIVKDQLRGLDLKDLYDHYDFNYNIEERAVAIRSEILNGTYKVSQPLIYRIEKKFGVCRHLVIPQPIDSLVLQSLIENIAEKILANQPSENAFYSRDKHNVNHPHKIDEYGLSWRKQWKQLQKKIYKFNEDKELIIVTDLSNYYDSIDIKELRKVFTSYTQIDEVLIDLLFKIIEEISWKPDYLPYSGRGLPTTNIEGIRLLAHSFLFELDEVIKQKTNNSFTRWMDDIVMGVDTRKEAIETISAVSDMLKSRGLALSLAKTNIYSDNEGYYHFQIEANRWIDEIETTKKSDRDYKKICIELHKRFKKHFKDKGAKYWGKIAKRYITTYGKLKATALITILSEIYVEYPELRVNLLIYLSQIRKKKKTSEVVIQILKSIDIFDDLSLYQLCSLVTQWEIPINDQSKLFLKEFEKMIIDFSFKRKIPSDFYCILWFKAKYSHPEELLKFINKYQNLWQTDSFLRRQVTSILSRLVITNSEAVEKLLFNQISSGITNTVTLANQIFHFSKIERLDKKLNYYLFPEKIQRTYPLGKFLVLCSVLNSEKIRTNKLIKEKIKRQIKDPYYLKWLDFQYNIN
ncbi:MAG: RNA-directed DNA polymerase [Deltaproteobacteria bacterium]|nr:RNA-directed DNA polymerase [Deltaproteobacteria bacterium]